MAQFREEPGTCGKEARRAAAGRALTQMMRLIHPRGITLRIALLGWAVTVLTLGVFAAVIVPEKRREFELALASKAQGSVASIRGVVAGAAVSEDYSAVVDQTSQVLAGDQAIEYVVITKNDGYSVVVGRSAWKIEQLGAMWHQQIREANHSIGISPLIGHRVFQYAFPFDYSGIPWGWIHIGLSLDAYDASVRRTYASTAGLTFLCGALSPLVGLLFARRLVRPIHILHTAVEKLAGGNLHARAEVRSNDDIESLAHAFNGMAVTILGRNEILEGVSFAAEQLLTASDPDSRDIGGSGEDRKSHGGRPRLRAEGRRSGAAFADGAAPGMAIPRRRLHAGAVDAFPMAGRRHGPLVGPYETGADSRRKAHRTVKGAWRLHRRQGHVHDRHPHHGYGSMLGG